MVVRKLKDITQSTRTKEAGWSAHSPKVRTLQLACLCNRLCNRLCQSYKQ